MSASSSSAAVAVDKATSDLLIGPDWTMNIDICDSVNSHHWQAKDVVKALKKRLQHKNSNVQLLALTLLETMVKNCGDYVHFQIAEKNILGEMVKIVRKKADMQVRDKILVLLDSWQEAFGGPGGKHPQYYFAYDELRRSGVMFPQRSQDASPIFTPPAIHLIARNPGYGMPSNSSRRLDETMATEFENLSLSNLDSMGDVVELLSDMLQAVSPGDNAAIKDEVIVDLVNRCRSNQKKLMQMLTTTGDEDLLARGLELNDSLQSVLAKHDAIASVSSVPGQVANSSSKPMTTSEVSTSDKSADMKDSSPRSNLSAPAPVAVITRGQLDEEEEEEDDFAQLARRHSKAPQTLGQNSTSGTSEMANSTSATVTCTTLALPNPPAPVRTTKEQDMIDLLSLALTTTSTSPGTQSPSSSSHSMHQAPVPPYTQSQPYAPQTYPEKQTQVPYNNYVAPWAQALPQPQRPSQSPQQFQSQPQFQPQKIQAQFQNPSQFPTQPQTQFQPQLQYQNSPQLQSQSPNHFQPQLQSQAQYLTQHQPPSPMYPQCSPAYPPPPWAATPGYFNRQHSFSTPSNPQPTQVGRPAQLHRSHPSLGTSASTTYGDPNLSSGPRNPAPAVGQKKFIPSYRLFEDLNVLGGADARLKMANGSASSLSGAASQGMIGSRK